MTTFLGLLMILSLLAFPIGLILLIIKLIRKKPVKKTLKLLGGSIAVFFISVILFPTDTDGTGTVQDAPAQDPPPVIEDVAGQDVEPAASETAEADTGAPYTRDNDAEYIESNIWLKNITDFSEGRAWVEFSDNERKKGSVKSASSAVNAALGGTAGKILYALQNGSQEGTHRAAVIDTHGKIMWQSDLTFETSTVLAEKSNFCDGVAYCLFNGNEAKTYCIIDGSGNLTYSREKSDDFQILGTGGGLFLIAKHVSGFDTEGWQFSTIDKNGNTVMPFQAFEKTPPKGPAAVAAPSGEAPDPNYDYAGYLEYQNQLDAYYAYQQYSYTPEPLSLDQYSSGFLGCQYMGDNIFQLQYEDFYVLLNVDTQKVIYTRDRYKAETNVNFLTKFQNGSATVVTGEDGSSKLCTLGTDGTFATLLDNAWTRRMLASYYEIQYEDGLFFVPYDRNLDGIELGDYYLYGYNNAELPNSTPFICHTGVYYSLDGKVAVDLPQYRGKHEFTATPFQNGHAALCVQGADGQLYVTAIDKSGKTLFEPVPGFEAATISDDGKFLAASREGELAIFDMSGKQVLSVKYIGIHSRAQYDTILYPIYNGVLRVNDFYVNVTDGTMIGLHSQSDRNFSLDIG